MKFKLDENLSRAAAVVLLEAGFDVLKVSDQQLEGVVDRELMECCVREERCLVTMDAEFGKLVVVPAPALLPNGQQTCRPNRRWAGAALVRRGLRGGCAPRPPAAVPTPHAESREDRLRGATWRVPLR